MAPFVTASRATKIFRRIGPARIAIEQAFGIEPAADRDRLAKYRIITVVIGALQRILVMIPRPLLNSGLSTPAGPQAHVSSP